MERAPAGEGRRARGREEAETGKERAVSGDQIRRDRLHGFIMKAFALIDSACRLGSIKSYRSPTV